jgi:hypothetical protein
MRRKNKREDGTKFGKKINKYSTVMKRMQTVRSSETSVKFYHIPRFHSSDDSELLNDFRENLKFYKRRLEEFRFLGYGAVYVNRRFAGTYRLHLQDKKSASKENQRVQSAASCSHWFLARKIFYPEDGGETFLRNVGLHTIYTALHHRRRYSS